MKRINKLVLIILIALFIIGVFLCYKIQWGWYLLIGNVVMTVIIGVKVYSNKYDGLLTIMADLATVFGICISPSIITYNDSKILEIGNTITSYLGLNSDSFGIEFYKNVLYITTVCLIFGIAALATKIFKDKTIMKKHKGKLSQILYDEKFKEKRKQFCHQLEIDINSIDKDTQWNDYYFTPLDAEVIIEEGNKTKKKSSDLMQALKNTSHENVFLILGEPGSGKSTTLRKLAKDLLSEVEKTNKIPIYINLKEWNLKGSWTPEVSPGTKELLEFIKDNLNTRLDDIFAYEFLNEYFKELYEGGHFFFIFDSFDEIPILLDEPESSWLVNCISAILYKIVAHNKNAKGLLSSRFYRQPTEQYQAKIKMEIRPFDESKIKICFERVIGNDSLTRKIYSEQKGLLSIAKNPFYSSLISLYYKDTQKLPVKEADLYESFIKVRLEQCNKAFQYLTDNNMSMQDVINYAKKIAVMIFENSQYGIEIPLDMLLNNAGIPNIVITILHKAKLMRIGSGVKKLVSFSHRRFNEYFVACSLININIESYKNDIPTDSKWRDTLVLYAQICSDEKAKELIEFCCEHFDNIFIQQNDEGKKIINDTNFRKAIHSLRFLTAAFSSMPQRLERFEKRVFGFVEKLLLEESILYHKLAAGAVPILSQENIEYILNRVLSTNISWINDDAISGCSYLNNLKENIVLKISKYYLDMDVNIFTKKYRSIMFFLSLSNNFKNIRVFCKIRMFQYISNLSIAAISFILFELNNKNFYDSSIIYTIICKVIIVSLIISIIVLPSGLQLNNDIGWTIILVIFFTAVRDKLDVILFIMILPFISVSSLLYRVKCIKYNYNFIKANFFKIIKNVKPNTSWIFSIPFFTALTVFLIYLVNKFIIITYVFYGIISIVVCIVLLIYFKNLHKDHIMFRKIYGLKKLERSIISKNIKQFSTSRYQKKYLFYLKNNNVQVYGEWDEMQIPKLLNSNLDVLLAQVEVKWLSL